MGCSAFAAVEVLQLLLFVLTPTLKYGDTSAFTHTSLLKRELLNYCGTASLHGVAYIGSSVNSFLKVVWTILVLIAVAAGLALSIELIEQFNRESLVTLRDLSSIEQADIDFPAITICPVQFNDPWNFPRLVLDHVRLLDDAGTGLEPAVRETFLPFWNALIEHTWVSAYELENPVLWTDNFNASLYGKVDTELYLGNAFRGEQHALVDFVLTGKPTTSKLLPQSLLESGTRPTIKADFRKELTFTMIAINFDVQTSDVLELAAISKHGAKQGNRS